MPPAAISTVCVEGAASGTGDETGSSKTTSGANAASSSKTGKTRSPSLALRRHDETWFGCEPYLAATSFTVAPGGNVSATIRAFNSSGQRRLPSDKKITPSQMRNSLVRSMEKLTSKNHSEKKSQIKPKA